MFEECLLSLFRLCKRCGSSRTHITKQSIGTFVRLKRIFLNCTTTFAWNSQPFLRDIPAGNLLLSASILFSGALPTQVVRVLTNLGCASISLRTYFSHQKDYLQPSILSVWMKEKSSLLQKLRSEQRALVIGGDGRADSPGHSAKYGSYTVMELQMGVVIDVQLVLVSHVFHPPLFIYCSYKVLFLIT